MVSFDNLAISQLKPQRLISVQAWDKLYIGDDYVDGNYSSASMFVDLVDKKFAVNSCKAETERFDLQDNIEDMYNFLKRRYKTERLEL